MDDYGEDTFNLDMIMHDPGFSLNKPKQEADHKTDVRQKSNLMPFQRLRTKKNKRLMLKKKKEKSKYHNF